VSADDGDPLAERARLVGRAALLLSVAPMLFYVWQAVGVPGIPSLGFGSSFPHADSGLVVRIADTSHGPVRVDHPARINPRRARAAAPLRAPRTIKSAVGPAASVQDAPPPPAAVTTPTRTTDATAATAGPSTATDVVREAPVAAPSLEVPSAQVPTVPSVQIPAVQIPPALPAAPALPALPPVLAPALP